MLVPCLVKATSQAAVEMSSDDVPSPSFASETRAAEALAATNDDRLTDVVIGQDDDNEYVESSSPLPSPKRNLTALVDYQSSPCSVIPLPLPSSSESSFVAPLEKPPTSLPNKVPSPAEAAATDDPSAANDRDAVPEKPDAPAAIEPMVRLPAGLLDITDQSMFSEDDTDRHLDPLDVIVSTLLALSWLYLDQTLYQTLECCSNRVE